MSSASEIIPIMHIPTLLLAGLVLFPHLYPESVYKLNWTILTCSAGLHQWPSRMWWAVFVQLSVPGAALANTAWTDLAALHWVLLPVTEQQCPSTPGVGWVLGTGYVSEREKWPHEYQELPETPDLQSNGISVGW